MTTAPATEPSPAETLDRLAIGASARIASVDADDAQLRQHILDMGLTPGTVVTMVKEAPMGDPLELRLRGYELTLRKAEAARIGIVDRIFTRIGASDDLSAGQSTFMVEMTEVSDILRCATSRSLLILDEIGRGTSTFDGMSIARAVLEYCADPKKLGAKTLFATHYHELTAMEGTLPGVKNYNIAVKTRGEDIIFLRKIIPGGADRSYGIEVARLAGLPSTVVNRAKKILRQLEEEAGRPAPAVQAQEDQVSLTALSEGEVMDQLRRTQVDTLSPLEALNLLYELKKKLN